ncbi:unnamed protein product [Schistosoma intercalatum]|nr:unnamed protein product [Schistosoma intercalatum]
MLTFVDSNALLHLLVYFCVFSLCLGFLCSCSAGIHCCLLVPPFLNLTQCINSDPFLVMVLDIRCCPFQPWHLNLPSEWSGSFVGHFSTIDCSLL